MIIAGEASGDTLAAELVRELRSIVSPASDFAPRFFGAGGPRMAAAGVELAFDMTQHAVVGLIEVAKHYRTLRRRFDELLELACEAEPEVIICVDFSGFNRRFGHALKQRVRARRTIFNNWEPLLIQYVSPQVWASREGRAWKMAQDFDLLLSIFPFEKAWYAQRLPGFPVEFVGHPMLDRYRDLELVQPAPESGGNPMVALLPGSRKGELERHLPVMLGAWRIIQAKLPSATATMVLPTESLLKMAQSALPGGSLPGLTLQLGDLAGALQRATVAMACTGTVTMECAYFKVPTVALYKTSWSTFQIGKRLITVKYLAMPNLLADEVVFPEFIQEQATQHNLAVAILSLLGDEIRRLEVKAKLAGILGKLGGPGGTRRAAQVIAALISDPAGDGEVSQVDLKACRIPIQ